MIICVKWEQSPSVSTWPSKSVFALLKFDITVATFAAYEISVDANSQSMTSFPVSLAHVKDPGLC